MAVHTSVVSNPAIIGSSSSSAPSAKQRRFAGTGCKRPTTQSIPIEVEITQRDWMCVPPENNIYLGRIQRVYLIWCFMPAHVMSVFMVRWCISVSGPSKRVWWNGRDFSSIFEQCILTLQRSPGRICMAYFENTFYILVLVYILIVQPCQSEGRLKCFLDAFEEYCFERRLAVSKNKMRSSAWLSLANQ